MDLKAFFAGVDALATPDEKIAALIKAVNDLADANSKITADFDASSTKLGELQDKYDALEKESTEEIARLSKELSFATNEAGKTTLSVTVGEKRYVTPAGRKYNIAGKDGIAIEDIVKDDDLVAKLISQKSGIFTPSAE
jgi:plasmid maintenance system antidote protein VapI